MALEGETTKAITEQDRDVIEAGEINRQIDFAVLVEVTRSDQFREREITRAMIGQRAGCECGAERSTGEQN
jgi:hypothetical protein